MQLQKIYEILDSIAPFALSREYCDTYGFHDNSGVMLDCGAEIGRVLFSLDLSARAVEEAKRIKAGCIVTHHPAIFYPVSSLRAGEPLTECAKAGISVVSAHLNLDSAAGGIDEELMIGLGGHTGRRMHALSDGGYGRVYEVEEEPLAAFAERVRARFCTDRLVIYGSRPVKKIASFCGAGMDESSVAFALEEGADTFVSSDGKHHLIAALVERGINVVLLTHYAAENYGFLRFAETFAGKVKESGVAVHPFTDERLL